MPHATDDQYRHIQATPLAPTFGAEITGIDFSKPVEPEVFAEVKDAITKVSTSHCLASIVTMPSSDQDISTACLCFAKQA